MFPGGPSRAAQAVYLVYEDDGGRPLPGHLEQQPHHAFRLAPAHKQACSGQADVKPYIPGILYAWTKATVCVLLRDKLSCTSLDADMIAALLFEDVSFADSVSQIAGGMEIIQFTGLRQRAGLSLCMHGPLECSFVMYLTAGKREGRQRR